MSAYNRDYYVARCTTPVSGRYVQIQRNDAPKIHLFEVDFKVILEDDPGTCKCKTSLTFHCTIMLDLLEPHLTLKDCAELYRYGRRLGRTASLESSAGQAYSTICENGWTAVTERNQKNSNSVISSLMKFSQRDNCAYAL